MRKFFRMAKRNKKTRADETLIDINQARDQAQTYVEKNQNIIFGVLAAIVLIVGGYMGYRYLYQAPREARAIEQMHRAEYFFRQDSFAKALTDPGGGYPGFLEIADQYGNTRPGNLAKYYIGISYLNLGQFDAAIAYLEEFKPRGTITPALKFGAIGDAHAELGRYDQALRQYKRASETRTNKFITPYYLHKYGLLAEKQGQYREALEAFKKIRRDYPQSVQFRDTEKYIGRIEAKMSLR